MGDVAYAEACSVASHVTPVPGGVGPMTVAMLMWNTVLAAKRQFDRLLAPSWPLKTLRLLPLDPVPRCRAKTFNYFSLSHREVTGLNLTDIKNCIHIYSINFARVVKFKLIANTFLRELMSESSPFSPPSYIFIVNNKRTTFILYSTIRVRDIFQ